jgi:predicted nucleic acid-binding protein
VIVYAETNFVLELALLQEQWESCETLLGMAEARSIRLVVPAYSVAEPYETLQRRHAERRTVRAAVDRELRELGRTATYSAQVSRVRELSILLIESGADERRRLGETRERLSAVAEIAPLDGYVLQDAARFSSRHGLSAQDAVVYASVLRHLSTVGGSAACFLNRNTRDFDDPDMIGELRALNCRLIPGFDGGLEFVRRSLSQS